ncbi:MAG TPA: hypothetical protein VHQ45_01045, partial [Gemmatimonadaceae bacterium]|nr:hypothetical protein [Gemmatimonadaceae bacterium]
LEREVRRGRPTYIIGTAAHADPDLIVRAMRAGVHEFLVYPPDPKDLSGAVDRLLRRTHAGTTRGLVVAVYSTKGGLGTTSVAVNLAYAMARNNPDARVALADFVVAGGDVGVQLDLRPSYDIGDLVAKMSRIDAELLYSLLTPCDGGVWVLPAADKPEQADAIDANAASAILEHLRGSFGFTVVDCEHHLSDRTLAALDAADKIVLLTQLNVPALKGTQRTLALARRLGYAEEKLSVVVNRHGSGDVMSVDDAAKVLDHEIAFRIPNDYRTASAALVKGVSVTTYAEGSALAGSYQSLAATLGGVSAHTNGNGHGRTTGSRLGRLLGMGRKS